jgi:hypothetical protein
VVVFDGFVRPVVALSAKGMQRKRRSVMLSGTKEISPTICVDPICVEKISLLSRVNDLHFMTELEKKKKGL